MRNRAWIHAIAISFVVAPTAWSQSIGLYFDAAGTTCSATVQPFTQTTVYVLARLEGPVSGGIQGVEFRLAGFPSEWILQWQWICSCIPGVACGSASCSSPCRRTRTSRARE